MSETPDVLRTTADDLPLHEYHLRLDARDVAILHTGAVVSWSDEDRFLRERDATPYGVMLWPASIALAHELSTRGAALRGRTVLELGAGTGLPGIVAAGFGARVVQTDRQPLALEVCRRNAARNGVRDIALRSADWTAWDDGAHYDLVIGADVLYAAGLHDALRRIFETNLAPGGVLLLADPFRGASLPLLQEMERDGWCVTLTAWRVGADGEDRPIGVFEATRPS